MSKVRKHATIHSLERAYDGFFNLDVMQLEHSLYKGGTSEVLTREVFKRSQAVVVLLYDLQAEAIVLVEQVRVGALVHHQDEQAWLIEPVAGMIDESETALDACRRETLEEAGILVENFEFIYKYYPSPGGASEILHLYAAEIDINQVPEFGGLAAEAEDIKILKMPFAQAKEMLLQGKFNVASTILAFQWLFFQKL